MNTPIEEHNLHIHMYSFDEILGLFDLSYEFSIEDLKRAKTKVLSAHPDRSKLSSEYFLFYKKAFEMVVQYYQTNNKQSQSVPNEPILYNSQMDPLNKSSQKQISKNIQKMKPEEFQEKFNDLFEKNMVKKQDIAKNTWFSDENPQYNIDQPVSHTNMNSIMENMKKQNQNLIPYKGVQHLYSEGGTNIYDDENDTSYATSNPFSKLKYDDLRKVHKDQTILAVSERDFQNVPKYHSVDQFQRMRGQQDLSPLQKTQAEKLLLDQERIFKEKMAQKRFDDTLRTQQYEEKNKTVLSTFMHLEN